MSLLKLLSDAKVPVSTSTSWSVTTAVFARISVVVPLTDLLKAKPK